MRSGRESQRGAWGTLKFPLLILGLILLVACGGGGGYQQPPSLSYPSTPQIFVVGTAITPITPTVTGRLSGFAVSPALPAGLALSSSTGVISGAPTAVATTTTYSITAVTSGGAAISATLTVTVNDVPPSNISYGASSLSYSATLAASTLTPTVGGGGKVTAWSISPALPSGLVLDATTGSISGTPAAATPSASYVVTAQNSGGQSTVAFTLQVDAPPLMIVGHQYAVEFVRATATNVLTMDQLGYWILWGYSGATAIATGYSDCAPAAGNNCTPVIDIAGSTAVITRPTGFEVRATSDGHVLGTVATSATWWKLATDGSYIAAGSSTSLSAWSPSGTLLFSNVGDYSQAVSFATPSALLIALGAKGQSVIETVSVPSGTSTTGQSFSGSFGSWFTDGGAYTSISGTTALIYSAASVQQGSIASVPANAQVVGQGNWVWTYPTAGGALNIYAATGTNPPATATFTFTGSPAPVAVASGTSIGVFTVGSTAISLIDLSGATPTETNYTSTQTVSVFSGTDNANPFAAVSASQWLFGNGDGVVVDGATLSSAVRYFGYGGIGDIVGGTGYFAATTSIGAVLYFNSSTLALEGQLAFDGELAMSSDGTLLVVMSPSYIGNDPVEIYSLPSGNLLYTWNYTNNQASGGEYPDNVQLAGSGTVLAQIFNLNSTQASLEVSAPTGGSVVLSQPFTSDGSVRLSPDGTLIAYTTTAWPASQPAYSLPISSTLLLNGTQVATVTGWPAGWLDNSRLVMQNYQPYPGGDGDQYTGCTLYGADGSPTGGACALPELLEFQPVATDSVFVPGTNQIVSVSTGAVLWASGDWYAWPTGTAAAVAGSNVVFVSGTTLLVQSY